MPAKSANPRQMLAFPELKLAASEWSMTSLAARLLAGFTMLITIGLHSETISNSDVRLTISATDATWNAQWLNTDVSLSGVSFAVEVEGKTLKPKFVSTKFNHDSNEIVQSWTDGLEMTRSLKLST